MTNTINYPNDGYAERAALFSELNTIKRIVQKYPDDRDMKYILAIVQAKIEKVATK
jgi:hypothetical protein